MPRRVALLLGSGIPGSMQTRSPTLRCLTSLPISITVPAASWPGCMGARTDKLANGAMRIVVDIAAANAYGVHLDAHIMRPYSFVLIQAHVAQIDSLWRSSTSACIYFPPLISKTNFR